MGAFSLLLYNRSGNGEGMALLELGMENEKSRRRDERLYVRTLEPKLSKMTRGHIKEIYNRS